MTTPSTIPTPETDAQIYCKMRDEYWVKKDFARSIERRLSIALSTLEKLNDMLELGPVLWQASKRHEHAQKLIENTLDQIKSLAK